jgi:hypothetical protein
MAVVYIPDGRIQFLNVKTSWKKINFHRALMIIHCFLKPLILNICVIIKIQAILIVTRPCEKQT